MARAGANHDLVERDAIPLDEAFDQLIDPFLHLVFPLPALDQGAQSLWHNPSWEEAARWYHEELRRTGRPSLSRLVVSISDGKAVFHPELKFYHRVLDNVISFDRAVREIEKRRQR